jgi:hypothetical protein
VSGRDLSETSISRVKPSATTVAEHKPPATSFRDIVEQSATYGSLSPVSKAGKKKKKNETNAANFPFEKTATHGDLQDQIENIVSTTTESPPRRDKKKKKKHKKQKKDEGFEVGGSEGVESETERKEEKLAVSRLAVEAKKESKVSASGSEHGTRLRETTVVGACSSTKSNLGEKKASSNLSAVSTAFEGDGGDIFQDSPEGVSFVNENTSKARVHQTPLTGAVESSSDDTAAAVTDTEIGEQQAESEYTTAVPPSSTFHDDDDDFFQDAPVFASPSPVGVQKQSFTSPSQAKKEWKKSKTEPKLLKRTPAKDSGNEFDIATPKRVKMSE